VTYAITATVVSTASHREHFSPPEEWIRNQQTGGQGGGGNEARQKMSSNLLRVELGNRMAPWATGRAEEQRVDDVQPGKIADTVGEVCFRVHQIQVQAVQGPAGVGRSLAIRMAWQTMQGGSGWPLHLATLAKAAESAGVACWYLCRPNTKSSSSP
jgi:hypothetical protein